MEFPGDDVMLLLLSVAGGEVLRVRDGRLDMDIPHVTGGTRAVTDVVDEYAALVDRGWLSDDDPPAVTDRGHYALGRWLSRRGRKGVDTRTIKVGVFKG